MFPTKSGNVRAHLAQFNSNFAIKIECRNYFRVILKSKWFRQAYQGVKSYVRR